MKTRTTRYLNDRISGKRVMRISTKADWQKVERLCFKGEPYQYSVVGVTILISDKVPRLKGGRMAGKRDQSEMSLPEFKDAGMGSTFKPLLATLEGVALAVLAAAWSKQAVTRLKNSAKKYGIAPLELLGRFIRKA